MHLLSRLSLVKGPTGGSDDLTPHRTATRIPKSHDVGISSGNTNMTSIISSLRKQIASCEVTLQDLRQQLAEAEHNQRETAKVVPQKRPLATDPTNPLDHDMNFGVPDQFREEIFAILDQEQKAPQHSVSEVSEERPRWPLQKNEYKRYGRQLIMPEIGLKGKSSLSHVPRNLLNRAAQVSFA